MLTRTAALALTAPTALLLAAAAPAQFFTGGGRLTFGTPPGFEVKNLTISADERIAVFASDRPGGAGGLDLWIATRATAGGAWGPAAPLTALNSAADDDAPGLSSDGLELFFASRRAAGPGPRNLWVSTRASTASPWGAPALLPAPVNGAGRSTADPQPTDDGLTLCYASNENGTSDLLLVRRAQIGGPWGQKLLLPVASSATAHESSPAPEANGGILWFSSEPSGGGGDADLYVTWLEAANGQWAAPNAVAELNTIQDEAGAFTSAVSGLFYWDTPSVGGPIEIGCICRSAPRTGTEHGASGWVSGAASVAWPMPVLFATGQEWDLGTTVTQTFYDWKPGDGVVAWGTLVAASRAPISLPLPFLALGALELDPASLAPLGAPLGGAFGYATFAVPVPNAPALSGATFWLQAVAARASGALEMTPPHRIALR